MKTETKLNVYKRNWLRNISLVFVVSVISVAAEADRITSYTYYPNGLTHTVDGPRINVDDVTTYTYHDGSTPDKPAGTVHTIEDAEGNTTTFESYNASGLPLTVIDSAGITTVTAYDAFDRIDTITVKHPTDSTKDRITDYSFYADGMLEKMILPNGSELTYTYNDANQLKEIINGKGEKIIYTLDAAGNQEQAIYYRADGTPTYILQQAFDELSRVKDIFGEYVIPDGQTEGQFQQHINLQYDADDNLRFITDGKSRITEQQYDELHRLSKIIEPFSNNNQISPETTYGYDELDQLTTVIDANGNTTTYTINGLGEVEQLDSPDTGVTDYTEYDEAGNIKAMMDARGVVSNYTYDSLNRLTIISYPAKPEENVTYIYCATNELKCLPDQIRFIHQGQETNGSYPFTQEYTYTDFAEVASISWTHQGISSGVTYGYQDGGNLETVTYSNGREVTYTWNADGQITDVKTTLANVDQTILASITYKPFGPANSYTLGNGLVTTIEYTSDYQVKSIAVDDPNNTGSEVLSYFYEFDDNGNIEVIQNLLDSSRDQFFNFDEVNRLTGANGIYGSLGYTYDPVGNRTLKVINDGSNIKGFGYQYYPGSNQLQAQTYILDNVFTEFTYFQYDQVGNEIIRETYSDPTSPTPPLKSSQAISFNDAGRRDLLQVDGQLAGGYKYNPLGQRIWKWQPSGAVEHFNYGVGGELLQVLDAAGNPVRQYIYFADQAVAMIDHASGSPIVYYIHNDHLGTPHKLTDQSKQVAWSADYLPFGSLINTAGTEIFQRFPGQYQDQESGLYYNYFRDYDPELGRYIQSDPIGLNGGINTYAYAYQNPLLYTDVFGLTPRGERGASGGSSGKNSKNPYKKCRQHPTKPNKIICKHHQTGKDVEKPKPADWDDYKREQADICENGDTCQKVATVVVVGGVAYIAYRCVRFLPSLAPPLWPTIPANLAIP